MSLINQALKKEQQRRSLHLRDTSPEIPVYDSSNSHDRQPAKRKPNRGLNLLLGLAGSGLVLCGMLGAFIYFGKSYLASLGNGSPADSEPESGVLAAKGATLSTVNQILDEVDSTSIPEEPVETGAAATPSDAQDAIAKSVESEDSQTSGETTVSEPDSVAVEESEPEPALPEFDYKIQDFVDQLQVFGYRSAGIDTRLLMNGRIFKLNDTIDHERGLVFRGSDGESLIFEAPSGYFYKKPL